MDGVESFSVKLKRGKRLFSLIFLVVRIVFYSKNQKTIFVKLTFSGVPFRRHLLHRVLVCVLFFFFFPVFFFFFIKKTYKKSFFLLLYSC